MTLYQRLDHPGCGCAPEGAKAPSFDAALEIVLALARPVAWVEQAPLAEAAGRVLAAPVIAAAASPRFDAAAMDGYALRRADLAGAGPWSLPVAGTAAAGAPACVLPPGAAFRILTGAPVPSGADAVIPQEETKRQGDAILIAARPAPGRCIRREGEEQDAGAVALLAGRLLDARALALAAVTGAGALSVRRRVRVALVATGAELSAPGAAPAQGGIFDANTPMLAALLSRPALELIAREQAPDDRAALSVRLAALSAKADLIVTTGGVSVGDADIVRAAVQDAGGTVALAGAAIRPGKPVSAGRIGGAVWLGLPGNPAAAFTTFAIFGAPLLAALAGETKPRALRRHVVLTGPLSHAEGRCEFRPARIVGFDGFGRELAYSQAGAPSSAQTAPLAEADGWVLIPGDDASIQAGALLEYLPFPDQR